MSQTDIQPDIATLPAARLAQALRQGQISAVEAAQAAIERIERLDGPINAVVVRDFDRALLAAQEADLALAKGERGALLGVPMTVKEAFDVEGLPTNWGSPAFSGYVADVDAVAVARLKGAGAVILGKTNVAPMLGDWQSDNAVYGRTNNPFDLGRTPGGSSGGSAAALASGMTPLEFGSDIGGSIRVPSSFCGLYGHQPTFELVPSRGHGAGGLRGAPVALGVVGPMARTAEDLALALEVTAGPDVLEAKGYRARLAAPRHESLADYRVLLLDDHPLARTDSEIRQALGAAAESLESAGGQVTRHSDLLPNLAAGHEIYLQMLSAVTSRDRPDPRLNVNQWLAAVDAQWEFKQRWAALFEEIDIVLAPCFGVPAFVHSMDVRFSERVHVIDGDVTPYGAQIAWPGMATFPGLPATALPIGRTRGGLPIGAQAIGGHLEDRTTIAFAGLLGQMLNT